MKEKPTKKRKMTIGLFIMQLTGFFICAFSVVIIILLNKLTHLGFWSKCAIVASDVLIGAVLAVAALVIYRKRLKTERMIIDDIQDDSKKPVNRTKYTEYGNLQISINAFALISSVYLTAVSIWGTISYSDQSNLSAYCCTIVCGFGLVVISIINTIFFKRRTWFLYFRDVASFVSIIPALLSISNIPMGSRIGGFTLIYCIILAAQWAMTAVSTHRKPIVEKK